MGLVKGRRPSGAVLHSAREPGVRRPCSDFMGMLRRLINCRIIIITVLSLLSLSLSLSKGVTVAVYPQVLMDSGDRVTFFCAAVYNVGNIVQ